jgi:hypothetical protein
MRHLPDIAVGAIRSSTAVWNGTQLDVLTVRHRNSWGAIGDLAITQSIIMIEISERYRAKALASEARARFATDSAIRDAWNDIAIEWHALAHRTAIECSKSAQPVSL